MTKTNWQTTSPFPLELPGKFLPQTLKIPLKPLRSLLHLPFLFLLLPGIMSLAARNIPPKEASQVYDLAGILQPGEREAIQQTLKDWRDSTSIEMAVVIDASLEGEDVFEYSLQIARGWGIGDGSANNGILLYLALEDRKLFLHIGPGLQGVIPDALAKRIIENQLKPYLREERYGEGITRSIATLQELAAGTYSGATGEDEEQPFGFFFLLFILLLYLTVSYLYRAASRRPHTYSRWGDHPSGGGMWFLPGGFGSGGGGDSGSSGGFDFGGGDFDGGGAGGDW